MASAVIVLSLSLVNLVLTASGPKENPIDAWVFEVTRRLANFRVPDDKREIWVEVIEKVVLNISDQQLLTGTAVLIASFWTHCSISVYHFTLASDLAWFSANVHLTTLPLLANLLEKRPVLRNWRVFMMACLAVMLATSSVMQGHWNWYESWAYNAQCLFDDLYGNVGGEPAFWMAFNLVFIGWDYPRRIALLYEHPGTAATKWLLEKPEALINSRIEELGRRRMQTLHDRSVKAQAKHEIPSVALGILVVIRTIHRVLAAIFASRVMRLLLNIGWFVYGLYNVIHDRNIPTSEMNGTESEMSFGQITPILLLSSTVFVLREAYDGEWRSANVAEYHLIIRDLDAIGAQKQLSFGAIPQTNLANDSGKSRLTTHESHEMSGAMKDPLDETGSLQASPRRVYTETRGRLQASGHGAEFMKTEPQRRTTLPSSS